MNPRKEGQTELGHEVDPGYARIFYVVLAVTVLYLVIILGATL
ncbi:MAG TPA: hypothetical protein VJ805_07360 [Nitrospiraceae bacterium]|nr:hypothetical protein [Nitrospiraceae bacterium]